jgi:Zn-finger nucleic acid-binding protein
MPDATPDPIACPKCHVRMDRVDAAGVAVDRCVKCGGVWLDQGELDALMKSRGGVKEAIAGLDSGPAVGPRGGEATRHVLSHVNCPRDASQLITMVDLKQTHIQYEACTVCGGVFMDCGELKDLSQFTLRERLAGLFNRR